MIWRSGRYKKFREFIFFSKPLEPIASQLSLRLCNIIKLHLIKYTGVIIDKIYSAGTISIVRFDDCPVLLQQIDDLDPIITACYFDF